MALAALEYLLLLLGSGLMLVAALGLWRLGDFYQRVHAPTKAATLGLWSVFLASVVSLGAAMAVKALLAILFIGATAPLGAHYLTRTAYRSGVRPRHPFVRDDLAKCEGLDE